MLAVDSTVRKSEIVMPLAVVLRRIFLITLLFLPQRYWLGSGWRIAGGLRRNTWRWIVRALITLAGLAMVCVLYDRIFHKFLPSEVSGWIAPGAQLWLFTSTFVFFAREILLGTWWVLRKVARFFAAYRKPAPHDPGRRLVLRKAASLAGYVPFAAAIYGYGWERLRFETVRVAVPVPGLPRALDGLRIAQLSDIHVGDFMPLHEVRRAVEIANDLSPHLTVITGDYLTSAGDPIGECIAELGRLRAPLGVWGCNGNHEIYAGAEEMAEKLFARQGMKLLRQSSAQVQWRGESLNIIGIDYQRGVPISGAALPSLNGAAMLVRRDMPNILLSHNPNTFPSAAAAGIELSLAGHTHGGQVNIEILNTSWSPARFMTNYVAGLYELPRVMPGIAAGDPMSRPAYLYVNRGIGTLGVPARLGSNPEITLLTLRAGS